MATQSLLLAAVLAGTAAPALAQHHHHDAAPRAHPILPSTKISPYASESDRAIKALSIEEQRAWLEGQGSGLARAAELNHHPGPMHVLELSAQLALTAEQERLTRALMERHKAEVQRLGRELIALETTLDRLFATGSPPDPAEASRLAEAIGALSGKIRASHLRTHIEQTALLTAHQVRRYDVERGYAR